MSFQTDNKIWNLDSPYQGAGFESAYNQLAQQQDSLGSNDRAGLAKRLTQVGDNFTALFKNNVGRAPNSDEINQFFREKGGSVILNSPAGRSEDNPTDVRNQIAAYVSDTFQPQAQEVSQQKEAALASNWGSLADQFMSMGTSSLQGLLDQGKSQLANIYSTGQTQLASLSNDLMDYQTRLFDKLRPQLNLAAQAGGYQNSGGQTLQEQGALRDLGTAAQGYLIPLTNQLNTSYTGGLQNLSNAYLSNLANIQQQANAIRYQGASTPTSLAASFAANQPAVLSNMGTGALNANFDTFRSNLDFAHQYALAQLQGGIESNLLNDQFKFGNQFSKNFGSTLGTNAGNTASNDLNSLLSSLPKVGQFAGG